MDYLGMVADIYVHVVMWSIYLIVIVNSRSISHKYNSCINKIMNNTSTLLSAGIKIITMYNIFLMSSFNNINIVNEVPI